MIFGIMIFQQGKMLSLMKRVQRRDVEGKEENNFIFLRVVFEKVGCQVVRKNNKGDQNFIIGGIEDVVSVLFIFTVLLFCCVVILFGNIYIQGQDEGEAGKVFSM